MAEFALSSEAFTHGGEIPRRHTCDGDDVEDRWRAAHQQAGSGDLAALRDADPELMREDSVVLAMALRRVLDRLSEEGRALALGHSPTNEAAVLGLTGPIIAPMAKGAGVVVVAEGNQAHSEPAS